MGGAGEQDYEWFLLQLLKFLLSCVALVVMPDEDHQNLVKTVNIY